MILDLVTKSRSFRGYDSSRAVTREELEYLVKCARLAPSSVNQQPLKYYLANDPETVSAILPLTGWAKGLPQLQLPHPGKAPTAFVIICQDTGVTDNMNRFTRDVGIVAQTMLLAAAELGLGGCMLGTFAAGSLREALQLADAIKPLLVVAIGKPDETIVITDVDETGSTAYYRDENDVHYVPKRSVEELILNP